MLLSELYNFGKKVTVPYGFVSNKKLSFLITITSDGDFVDVSPLDKTGQNLTLTASVRGNNTVPNFLHDSLDYISGKKSVNSKGKDKVKKNEEKDLALRHLSFVNLHKEIQELNQNAHVKAINLFYEKNGAKKLNDKLDSLNYENTSGWFGFRIVDGDDYTRPHEDSELINFYSDLLLSKNATSKKLGQCSITGKLNQPLISISVKKIKGLPNSQPTGSSVYSNNFSSVECFGLKQLDSSSISQDADLKITNALEYLLDNSNHNLKLYDLNKVYVFWTDEPIDAQFNPFKFLDYKVNIEDISSFVSSWKSNKNKIDKVSEANCSLIEIITGTTRPLYKLHHFKESEIKNNLERWFESIKSEHGKFKYFSLYNLAKAIDNNSSYSKKIKQDLFDMMLFSKAPSKYLKVQINKESFCFAGPFTTNKRKELSHEKMALINCCIGYSNMEIKNHAYNYGKILAFADNLQFKALDKVNVSISQKFYRGSNPKRTFKELDNKIWVYIKMIQRENKGLGFFFEGQYKKLLEGLDLPLKFNDDEQLWKAKGFYDERLSKYNSQSEKEQNEITN